MTPHEPDRPPEEKLETRLRVLFAEELGDHSASMAVRLERLAADGVAPADESPEEALRELLRSAHSLKGAALAAGFPELESLCHAAEAAITAWRGEPRGLEAARIAVLRTAVDRLEGAASALRAGRDLDGRQLDDAARALVAEPSRRPVHPAHPELPEPIPEPGAAAGPRPDSGVAVAIPGARAAASPVLRLPADQLEALLGQVAEVLLAVRAMGLAVDGLEDGLEILVGGRRKGRRRRARPGTASGRGAPTGETSAHEADRAWDESVAVMSRAARAARSANGPLQQAAAMLRMESHRAGLLPFEVAGAGLDTVLRQAARATGKEARLRLRGGDVRIDRMLVAGLREPLVQLVRNAVAHGIEEPGARRRAGKPMPAVVSVEAEVAGNQVLVRVRDDGRGVDTAEVLRAAAELGLAGTAPAGELLFVPGLTTAPAATLECGRGIGLDVVRAAVENLGGAVTVSSASGTGTTVELVLPFSTATLRVLVAEVAGHEMAVPVSAARCVTAVTSGAIRTVQGRTVLMLGDAAVPLLDLAVLPARPQGSARATPTAVVVQAGGAAVALLVDAVTGEEEVVLRPPGSRLAGLPLVLGVARLPGGRLVSVLNPAACARYQGHGPLDPEVTAAAAAGRTPALARRVLLAEDSVTTRALERGILEGAGYAVLTAADGALAWALLAREDVDIVLADVDMPELDGLELCRRIRASSRLSHLPVVLVTSLGSAEDRARGVAVGADAYISKASFDQAGLLDVVARLL